VSHNLNLEGAPIFQHLLARGLRRRGHELHLASMADGPLRDRYRADGIPVTIVDALGGIHRPSAYTTRMGRLADAVARGRFDLVFANTLPAFWAVSVARRVGLPSVWAIHESASPEEYFAYLPAPLRPVTGDALRAATRLVFACDATRRLFAALDGPGRLRRIYYGLDVDAIDAFVRQRSRDEVRAAHTLDGADRVVTVVGMTVPRKGQLDFLRMAKLLDRSGVARLRFYVVGTQPGDYLDQLERFARDERLGSVVFVEQTPEVYEYFRMSDVLVCPSHTESLPLVVLEAMAFGLPIVSTDVFGVPEAVAHEREALLVGPGDVAALAAGVRRVLDDPALAARLGARARATLVERFTLDRMTDEYDRLMAECVAS
jgi:glycosyltransferase involved in cell wall biosynthesis